MNTQELIHEFLQQLEENPDEKQSYAVMFDLLMALDPPLTEVYGYGCMLVLRLVDIYLKDGRSLNDPYKSSHIPGDADIAAVLAIVFRTVNSNPTWWEVGYYRHEDQPEVLEAARRIRQKLLTLDIVERAEGLEDL